jgi:hypothetical protein
VRIFLDIPTDVAVQNYILSLAAKVRQQTITFKYEGDLAKDATSLGLKVYALNEALKMKTGITSVARELFKMIVPEHRRQVDHWNDLTEDVLLKEKILIGMTNNKFAVYLRIRYVLFTFLDFLLKYYGPLRVNEKQIHTSLVGCLRNERRTQKKQQGQSCIANNDENEFDGGDNFLQRTDPEDLLDD